MDRCPVCLQPRATPRHREVVRTNLMLPVGAIDGIPENKIGERVRGLVSSVLACEIVVYAGLQHVDAEAFVSALNPLFNAWMRGERTVTLQAQRGVLKSIGTSFRARANDFTANASMDGCALLNAASRILSDLADALEEK